MKKYAYYVIAVLFLVVFVTTFNYGGDSGSNLISGSSGKTLVGTAEDLQQWKEIIRDKTTSATSLNKTITPQTNGSVPSLDHWALSFDGIDDYVEIHNSDSLNITGAIAIEAWIKPNAVSPAQDWRALFYKVGPGATPGSRGGYGFLVTEDQSTICFFTTSRGVAFAATDLTLGEWNYVAGTYNPIDGYIAIYINGELKSSGNYLNYAPQSTKQSLFIGGNPNNDYYAPYEFSGSIDKVAIYNCALTAAEIQNHYQSGIPEAPPEGIVSYWPLEEGEGTTAHDVVGNNHGTIYGATWVQLLQPPQAPSNLVATAVSLSQIDLTWQDKSVNEQGSKIERKTQWNGDFEQIATVGANVTSYTDSNLSPTTTYYYRVKAYNIAGDSDYSNEVDATTLAPTIENIIVLLNQSYENGEITNYGVYHSLLSKLQVVQSSLTEGNLTPAIEQLHAFINETTAQDNKIIAFQCAENLCLYAESLLSVTDLAKAKEDAKKEIDKEADKLKKAIDQDKNLTPEQKKERKDKIDKIAEDGKKYICTLGVPASPEDVNVILTWILDTMLQAKEGTDVCAAGFPCTISVGNNPLSENQVNEFNIRDFGGGDMDIQINAAGPKNTTIYAKRLIPPPALVLPDTDPAPNGIASTISVPTRNSKPCDFLYVKIQIYQQRGWWIFDWLARDELRCEKKFLIHFK